MREPAAAELQAVMTRILTAKVTANREEELQALAWRQDANHVGCIQEASDAQNQAHHGLVEAAKMWTRG